MTLENQKENNQIEQNEENNQIEQNEENNPQTLYKLIKSISKDLITKTRSDGTLIITHKNSSPYIDLYGYAHRDNLYPFPDDHRYQFIKDIITALSDYLIDNPETEELQDIDFYELLDDYINPTEYTHDLTMWLSSSNSRYSYVDEAIETYGKQDTIISDIRNGMIAEIEETYNLIIDYIERNLGFSS